MEVFYASTKVVVVLLVLHYFTLLFQISCTSYLAAVENLSGILNLLMAALAMTFIGKLL